MGAGAWCLGGVAFLGVLALPKIALGDWKSDEAYLRQLEAQLRQLRAAAELFEQQRRTLELVEVEFTNLQLPLAEAARSPEAIIRQTLKSSFPRLAVALERQRVQTPRGVLGFRWRCRLTGPVEEIRWGTQLLLQKGLFVRPSAEEPVELVLERSQRRGTLSFIGHHLRLKLSRSVERPRGGAGDDALARRTDELAREIRKVQAEVLALRVRMRDVTGFEARAEAMRHIVARLRELTRTSRNPFRLITPLLDLELVRFSRIVHQGDRVLIEGAVPSPSARQSAARWIARLNRRKERYRVVRLTEDSVVPPTETISVPGKILGPGPRCAVLAAGARGIDLVTATQPGAVLAVGPLDARLRGRLARVPAGGGLAAACRVLGLALLREGRAALLLSSDGEEAAREALRRGESRRLGVPLPLRLGRTTVADLLARLRTAAGGGLVVPRGLLADRAPLWLDGVAPLGTWLRLLGATRSLRLEWSGGDYRLVPMASQGGEGVRLPERAPQPAAPSGVAATSLALLRPRLVVACPGSALAVLETEEDAPPVVVRRGGRLGRARSPVLTVNSRGVTLRWSEGGIRGTVLLPLGTTPEDPSGTVSPSPARRK